ARANNKISTHTHTHTQRQTLWGERGALVFMPRLQLILTPRVTPRLVATAPHANQFPLIPPSLYSSLDPLTPLDPKTPGRYSSCLFSANIIVAVTQCQLQHTTLFRTK